LRGRPRLRPLVEQLRDQHRNPVMRVQVAAVGLGALAILAACTRREAPDLGLDPGLEGLAVTQVAPTTIVPGTKLVVTGASFVDEPWGTATLHLQGQAGARAIDAAWPAQFIDFHTLAVAIDGGKLDELGGDADFHG